jgi:hypothetical protein
LYAAPHITTARPSASTPKVSIVICRRFRRGRVMQGENAARRDSALSRQAGLSMQRCK